MERGSVTASELAERREISVPLCTHVTNTDVHDDLSPLFLTFGRIIFIKRLDNLIFHFVINAQSKSIAILVLYIIYKLYGWFIVFLRCGIV